MSYEIKMYQQVLEIVNEIYNKSQKDSTVDLYRIKDLINAVNINQSKSKKWLITQLLPFIPVDSKIFIAGSWYGTLSIHLERQISGSIVNCDIDPLCKYYGEKIYQSADIKNITDDAMEHLMENQKRYKCIINTSCEHMTNEDLKLMIETKHTDAIFCFQSNNYFEVDSHINCHNSLEEFRESIAPQSSDNFLHKKNPKTILYEGELKLENCTRYMVIGK